MKVKKICVVTGTRAEYGLLFWLMKAIEKVPEFELQIIATGMHLSPEFGLTYRNIENDGFSISKKVEVLLSSDTPIGISKSIGLGVIGFADCYAELKPDLVIILGDRFEILAAATSAMIARIPIAHCHGGESTEGLIDEPIRHAVTKMSHLHFVSTEEYKRRVNQLGEQPNHIFNVGALGIENINRLDLLKKKQFEDRIGFRLGELNFLVTFHPVTLEFSTSQQQFQELLDSLDAYPKAKIIFTKANADTDGRIINEMIDNYVTKRRNRAIAFVSLGQLLYLSALQFMNVVIGNSSSGLIEAPSFQVPTVNIGDRQRGRIKGDTIIDCDSKFASIKKAIDLSLSSTFRKKAKNTRNPYGEGNASQKIVNILRNMDFGSLLKKRFYDL
jgi:GDP/UDP-N,N'-diacetylbacillosamine 2-epimerase (hydrolysing)